ncbi:MAG: flavin reductase family protein, partial [Chloroflexia bacterium]|nr:flavin reductase family protein [Chloroflexia bacterium]
AYDLATRTSANGVPVLADALGYIVCRVADHIDAGDSVLFVAEVVEAAVFADASPLTMREAGFRHAG